MPPGSGQQQPLWVTSSSGTGTCLQALVFGALMKLITVLAIDITFLSSEDKKRLKPSEWTKPQF